MDTNINNYNVSDLEKFFSLDPKKNYTAGDVELREYEIRGAYLRWAVDG